MKPQRNDPNMLTADVLSVFSYQLALMLQAGIPADEGIAVLGGETTAPRLRALLLQIQKELADGLPLAAALHHTAAFPPYFLRMIEIGQAAGRLEQVLLALTKYYRREHDLQQSLKQAVTYPAVMAILIAAIFWVLLSRVLPVFQQVYTQLGVTLSPLAQGLLQLGTTSKWLGLILGICFLLAVLWLAVLLRSNQTTTYTKLFSRTAAGHALDRSRFADAMSLMLASGLPLDEAVSRTAHLLAESTLAAPLAACQQQMEQGVSFPQAVAAAGLLPPLQAGLLAAGCRAGVCDQAMAELARRGEQEAAEQVNRLLSRFEYGLVTVLCVMVGLVLLSVMLPLLGVLAAIGG